MTTEACITSFLEPGARARSGRSPNAPQAWAFTRVELLVVLGVLTLLALVVLPAVANSSRSARLLCGNNLRLLGQACHQWSTDYGGRMPFRTPWCEGGTLASGPCPDQTPPAWLAAGLHNNVWFHFAALSNVLDSPRVLACPADVQKVPARQWGFSAVDGYLHPNYQNRAVSYALMPDILYAYSSAQLLSMDRNFPYSSIVNNCSSGIAPARQLDRGGPVRELLGTIHPGGGNVLLLSGAVEELSAQGFKRRLDASDTLPFGTTHYVTP